MADEIKTHGISNVKAVNPGADLPTFYVNNAEVTISTWDMRFRLGQVESMTGEQLQVKNTVTVFMSIQHARVFVEKTKQLLDAWDAANAQAQG